MKEFKGTPGPWGPNEGGDNSSIDIVLPDNTTITIDRQCRYTGDFVLSSEGMNANARLIAAAPELLSALKSCVMSMQAHPDCEPDSEFEGFVNKGWEAINKTLGE